MSDESGVLQAFSGLTGVCAIFLGYYAYRLTKRQRDDAWFHAFTSLHETSWNDDDLKYVRACIANDADYAELEPIVRKHRQLSRDEYPNLEKVDKFFNFLIRAREVSKELEGHRDLWEKVLFQYWLDTIVTARRHWLWLYYTRAFTLRFAPPSASVDTTVLGQFEAECAALEKKAGEAAIVQVPSAEHSD